MPSQLTVEEMARELGSLGLCPDSEKDRSDCPMDLDFNKIECWQCWMLYPAEIRRKYGERKGEKDEQ